MIKCIGCGAVLQDEFPTKEGYVKTLSHTLCERCFKIRHYNEYKFSDKDNDFYLNILKKIENTNDLVILVTDFLNMDVFNTIKIKNPVILVIAKRDIIPNYLDENKLLNNIKTNLNVVDKIIVGSKSNYHLDLLFDKIIHHKKSNDVYIVGYTNMGKSTLINKMIKNYGINDSFITTSILPSTTLDLIKVKINDQLNVIDTPGLLDEGSIILNVNGDILNKIIPKKEINPRVIQVKTKQTILINRLVRLDLNKGTNLVFYVSNELQLERFYKNVNQLNDRKKYNLIIDKNSDLVIKGLGFVKFTKSANIILYLDENVEFYIRQSII